MSRLFSVVSYNIHQCIGVDGRRDPERTASIIRDLAADVVGLQEVDSHVDGGTTFQQLDHLAATTGLTAIAGPTIQRENGCYGNALLTGFQTLAIRHVDLSVPGREPRGAIDADLDVEGETIRVIVTHLGLRAAERRFQMKRLLDVLSEERSRCVVVLGDINEWLPMSRPLRWLHTRLGSTRALRTFPSTFPIFALDRIWVRPPEALIEIGVHDTALTRVASDHLPLKAIIDPDGHML